MPQADACAPAAGDRGCLVQFVVWVVRAPWAAQPSRDGRLRGRPGHVNLLAPVRRERNPQDGLLRYASSRRRSGGHLERHRAARVRRELGDADADADVCAGGAAREFLPLVVEVEHMENRRSLGAWVKIQWRYRASDARTFGARRDRSLGPPRKNWGASGACNLRSVRRPKRITLYKEYQRQREPLRPGSASRWACSRASTPCCWRCASWLVRRYRCDAPG